MSTGKASIVVTGANGQLGHCLQKIVPQYPQFEFHFLGREHLPVDNHELARKVISAIMPVAVINAAAYTAVDKAESEPLIANNINGYAVGNLARHCKSIGAKFITLSTDYVFNGWGSKPYLESDPTDPVNAYGASKLLGEKLSLEENPASVIIRTSWLYSAYGQNFVKTMRRLFEERAEVKVVNDQQGCPTYAMDLAAAIMRIISTPDWVPGVYHFSNSGLITWYEFALAIKALGNYSCSVVPVTTDQFPVVAKRPAYSALDCSKIAATFGIQPPDWNEALQRYFKNIP